MSEKQSADMARRISQARIMQTGLYPREVVAKYARAQHFQPRMTISTFVRLYEMARPDGGISARSNDYCPRVSGVSEKLEVHKSIMQRIAIDTLASSLNQKTRRQCNEFMRNPDSLHVLISTRIKDHPLCPNTMGFYSQVLGKSDPERFHGELVNGIVAAVQAGWDDFSSDTAQWNFLNREKFTKFFRKRIQQFTNLEEPIDAPWHQTEPGLEPIFEPLVRTRPPVTPLAVEAGAKKDADGYRYYEDSIGSEDEEAEDEEVEAISAEEEEEEEVEANSAEEEEVETISAEDEENSAEDEEEVEAISSEEYSSDGVLEVASVLADSQQPKLYASSVGSKSLAGAPAYRPELVPVSKLFPGKVAPVASPRPTLVPLETTATSVDAYCKYGKKKTIPQKLVKYGLTGLVDAVKKAGLVDTLSTDRFTVFAPTNKALELAKADTLDIATLKQVLLSHVIPATVIGAMDVPESETEVTSASGQILRVRRSGNTVTINGDIIVVKANIRASNGIIHVIDRVILPSSVGKSIRSKLVPIKEPTAVAASVRPRLTPINEPRIRSKLVPLETQKPAAPAHERPAVPNDRLGGEALPRTSARRPNLVPIGAEISQTRQASTMEPLTEPTVKTVRPTKLVPIQRSAAEPKPTAVRARPKTIPVNEPTTVTPTKPSVSVSDAKFENVEQSMRWLESYLETHGPDLADELVFFAPTNSKAKQIVVLAETRGKSPSVKPIIECHLCEHGAHIEEETMRTVGGHTVRMGRRGKIAQPEVKSPWVDFVGTKDVAGFRVHVYAQGNIFTH